MMSSHVALIARRFCGQHRLVSKDEMACSTSTTVDNVDDIEMPWALLEDDLVLRLGHLANVVVGHAASEHARLVS